MKAAVKATLAAVVLPLLLTSSVNAHFFIFDSNPDERQQTSYVLHVIPDHLPIENQINRVRLFMNPSGYRVVDPEDYSHKLRTVSPNGDEELSSGYMEGGFLFFDHYFAEPGKYDFVVTSTNNNSPEVLTYDYPIIVSEATAENMDTQIGNKTGENRFLLSVVGSALTILLLSAYVIRRKTK